MDIGGLGLGLVFSFVSVFGHHCTFCTFYISFVAGDWREVVGIWWTVRDEGLGKRDGEWGMGASMVLGFWVVVVGQPCYGLDEARSSERAVARCTK